MTKVVLSLPWLIQVFSKKILKKKSRIKQYPSKIYIFTFQNIPLFFSLKTNQFQFRTGGLLKKYLFFIDAFPYKPLRFSLQYLVVLSCLQVIFLCLIEIKENKCCEKVAREGTHKKDLNCLTTNGPPPTLALTKPIARVNYL